eukprot:SAG11_NODE_1793_length_4252_cov_6.530701_4_plen_94_part_00
MLSCWRAEEAVAAIRSRRLMKLAQEEGQEDGPGLREGAAGDGAAGGGAMDGAMSEGAEGGGAKDSGVERGRDQNRVWDPGGGLVDEAIVRKRV